MAEIKTYYPLADNDPNDYLIVSNSDAAVTENFIQKELFNPKANMNKHPLSVQVVECVQAVRDFTGTPIRINSAYRNYVPIGGASVSSHMLGQAIDFSFIAKKEEREALYISIRHDFENKGPLFEILWDLGCRGFGLYDSFIHLDTTVSELYPDFRKKRTKKHLSQRFAIWNKMKLLRNRPVTNTLAINPVISIIETATGVVEGFIEEVMESEDRGADINAWNGGVFLTIIGGTVALMLLPFLLIKK